jgi:hypothetical protein
VCVCVCVYRLKRVKAWEGRLKRQELCPQMTTVGLCVCVWVCGCGCECAGGLVLSSLRLGLWQL